jgi:hypothetical protein
LPLGKPRFHLIARPSAGGTVDDHLFRHFRLPSRITA